MHPLKHYAVGGFEEGAVITDEEITARQQLAMGLLQAGHRPVASTGRVEADLVPVTQEAGTVRIVPLLQGIGTVGRCQAVEIGGRAGEIDHVGAGGFFLAIARLLVAEGFALGGRHAQGQPCLGRVLPNGLRQLPSWR